MLSKATPPCCLLNCCTAFEQMQVPPACRLHAAERHTAPATPQQHSRFSPAHLLLGLGERRGLDLRNFALVRVAQAQLDEVVLLHALRKAKQADRGWLGGWVQAAAAGGCRVGARGGGS